MTEDPIINSMGWTLVAIGLLIVAVGLWLAVGPSIPWLGRLPGDIRIERDGFRFYFPLTTCVLLSLVLSLALWIIRSLGR